MPALAELPPTMHCPHACVRCTTCENSAAARELRALRRVAEASLRVYRAWDQDLHHVNKMFALGRELRDAGYEPKPTPLACVAEEPKR